MSMIASVLHLDRRDIKALRITDPYSLHRVVYSLYDDVRSAEEKGGRVVYHPFCKFRLAPLAGSARRSV